MPKILITNPCQVNFGDDKGGIHQEIGDIPTVPKDVAATLVRAGRALYVSKNDDPDKNGRDTATNEMVAAAKEVAKSKAQAKAKTQQSGGGNGGQGGQG